jgi:hypothetical protein
MPRPFRGESGASASAEEFSIVASAPKPPRAYSAPKFPMVAIEEEPDSAPEPLHILG